MNCATLPALSFGIFDHLDHAGRSLRQQYSDRLKIAAACDEAGFRAYHVAKHHGTPHALAASPNLFLFAVAQRTRKLRLGPLVMLLNLYHSLRAFEEIWMLDRLSGGRLDLGIGRGAVPLELSFFGVSPAEAQDRYSEAAECPRQNSALRMDMFVRWSMSAVLVLPADGGGIRLLLNSNICSTAKSVHSWHGRRTNADAVRCSQAEFDRSLHMMTPYKG